MLSKVKSAFYNYNMPVKGADITVGVSGGADSVALLLALIDLSSEFSFALQVVHVNHNLRGDESLRDEIFVRDLCAQLNIPCHVVSVDIASLANERNESIELCARSIRYDAFYKHSKGLIATAHNADDNAETVIINLCRGTGLKGLCGIPPVRDNIIRPLIDCSRSEILEFLSQRNQPYVIDSSNNSDDYTRNKIRHNVIPCLKELNPSFETVLRRNSNVLRDDSEYIEKVASHKYSQFIEAGLVSFGLKNEAPAIRKRVLLMYYKELGFKPDNSHIEEMDRVVMGNHVATSLPNGFLFHATSRGFITEKKEIYGDFSYTDFSLTNDTLPAGEFYTVDLEKYKKLNNVNNLLFKFSIDCDKIIGNVAVRSRVNGDKYRPVGRKVTKSLRKLLCEEKPTYKDKTNLFIIEDERGIIFTNLYGIDERVKVTDASRKILIYEKSGETSAN